MEGVADVGDSLSRSAPRSILSSMAIYGVACFVLALGLLYTAAADSSL